MTINRGVETDPLDVVTTIVPDRAPTGIITVMDVGVINDGSLGAMLAPLIFTLSTELNPDPLIVTTVPTGPLVTDKAPVELTRGKTAAEGF